MRCKTDDKGAALVTVGLLEPYIFRVHSSDQATEYMPQEFVFQTDKRQITAVVARTVIGPLPEERVMIMVDASGSMQAYLDDVKSALALTLVQQFHKSAKQFNILCCTENVEAFRSRLVPSTTNNIEAAMGFVESLEAGGCTELLRSVEHCFGNFTEFDALYLVTDGKAEIRDDFLQRVQQVYLGHPNRPKLHVIAINCVPRRLTWRGLQALTLLTQAAFRPVCLEQAWVDPAKGTLGVQAACSALAGMDLRGMSSDEEVQQGSGEEEEELEMPG